MYEDMKLKIENAVEKGNVPMDYITSELDRQVFCKWKDRFSPQDHPSIIQVLLDGENDKDVVGDSMPNLIYVSREKRKTSPHHFKAGALNALLRVSAIMTNAPLVLTLDCDMFSNDPITVHRVLCFLMGHPSRPNLGFIQFPQKYHGLNKADIYSSEHKRLFIVNPMGMDGLKGPPYVGTGCFFNRRAFFGSPSKYVQPDTPELSPDFVSNKPISSNSVMDLAHDVAACNYEDLSNWGSQIGFRYGSLVEDYYTGYRLQCEGWQSIFCNPDRPAFLGDIPITMIDILSQNKRWCIGLLEVGFSNFSPIKYGLWALGPLVANSWAHYAFWPSWFIPITVYAYLPQLALLNELHIFPKLCDPWFFLYAFLFVGAYGQDCLDFILAEGTFKRWWSDQRMWIIRGLSSHTFGIMEYIMKQLGIETQGFNVTSKVIDDEQNVNYERGLFEFGVTSHLFIPLSVAAMLNFIAFFMGFLQIVVGRGKFDQVFVQMFIAGFGIMNSLPFYDAMFLRADKGKMHIKTIIHSALVVGGVYIASKILFGIGYK